MSHVLGLRCVLCGAEYAPSEVTYVCPKHGAEGILDVVYDYPAVARQLTREALAERPSFAEALLNLGHALKSQGQPDEARLCWHQALEAKPELAKGYFEQR